MQIKAYAGKLAVILLALFGMTSCGYRLSGTGELVPKGAKTIAIPVFINATNEPYVDVEVTKAVVNEFLTDGRLELAGLEGADVVLRGKVTRYEVTALSYTPNAYVQQYRVRLLVEASLEDQRVKKTVWQEKGIEAVFISDYPVAYSATGGADIQATKAAKETAIRKAAQDIAWTLRSRVLEGF